jgi:ankyrin repeat protein
MSALRQACLEGDEAAVNSILATNIQDIESSDAELWRPLTIASREGHLQIVKLLLDYGANIEARGSTANFNALCVAAQSSHAEVVELLLALGAEVDITILSEPGGTMSVRRRSMQHWVLISAATGGNLSILKLLIEYGATIDTPYGIQALDVAIEYGHTSIILYLLDKGVTVAKGPAVSVLVTAVEKRDIDSINLLLDHGTWIDYPRTHRARLPPRLSWDTSKW